ncbi:MAG: hypothetical protein HQK55_00445 [Deltaproteobacteria bacterium]|nr:hypothetical protein [Deltaproteobacteria bacterium]
MYKDDWHDYDFRLDPVEPEENGQAQDTSLPLEEPADLSRNDLKESKSVYTATQN